jgi:hypothetical protein
MSEQHLDLLPEMTRTLVDRSVCQASSDIARVTEEQIIGVLREQEAGAKTADLVGAGDLHHAIYDCINEISLRFDVESSLADVGAWGLGYSFRSWRPAYRVHCRGFLLREIIF